jgi:hypothetical protein
MGVELHLTTEGKNTFKGVWEQGADENIWT